MLRLIFILIFFTSPLSLFSVQAKGKFNSLGYSGYALKDSPLIVLDAGHGGLDLGARCRMPFCEEKRITLTCATLAKKYLNQLGYRVLLTRSKDIFLPLPRRLNIAHQSRCELFVSIHFNSSPNKEAQGIEVFYCEKEKNQASKKLATIILQDLIDRTSARSRGVKKGNFFVIREAKVPAILIEGGFISNLYERNLLRKREYLDKIAQGIADGIDKYLKNPKPTETFN